MTEAERVISECRLIAAMSEEPGRTTRRSFTAPMHKVHDHLGLRMAELEMTARVDAAGNLRGLWQPTNAPHRRLVIGSHIDSVPDAGAFDGVLGVVLALEWIRIARSAALPLAIELIAFSDEEGVRFGAPFLGSRAVAGRFDPQLLALKDEAGETLESTIRAFGLDPAQIAQAEIAENCIGFVEVHIEQGPILEAEGLGLAAVSAIAGQSRLSLAFEGQASHAGTTPMSLRRDALAGAAEWITAIESAALRTDGLVATAGRIAVEPNAGNVIAARAEVSLDVRHAHDSVRLEAVEELVDLAHKIAERRQLTVKREDRLNQPAVPMDERLTQFLADAIETVGHPGRRMPSGAGHDAMVMAAKLPTAMLFLRSPGGLSHHPDEAVRAEDVEAALAAGRQFLMRLSSLFL